MLKNQKINIIIRLNVLAIKYKFVILSNKQLLFLGNRFYFEIKNAHNLLDKTITYDYKFTILRRKWTRIMTKK